MSTVHFREADIDEFDEVNAFYDTMIDVMAGTDFDVKWRRDVHPSPAMLKAALEAGELYVGVIGDRIASALVMDANAASGYEDVPWQTEALPGEFVVVHLLGVLPEYHGQGIATQMMRGALEAARAKGMKAVRLDVLPHNQRGVGLYEKVGFTNHGPHALHYPELGPRDFVMFEYVLEA